MARLHNLDPSAISRTISSLEEELGVRLFERTTRTVTITPAGAAYFERVAPVVDQLQHARAKAASLHSQPRGTLRITAPVSFSQLNILPYLPRLATEYPELSFDLLLTDASIHLVRERIDVAVRLGPLSPSEFVAYRLCQMVGKICASPHYLRMSGRPDTPLDLQQHNCLLLDMPGFENKWRFSSPTEVPYEVQVQGNLKTSNAVALKGCAIAGMGVILQDRWIVGKELQSGALIDLFPGHSVSAAGFDDPAVWILYPSRAYVPPKVRVFVDFLKGLFREGPPWSSAGILPPKPPMEAKIGGL